VGETDQEAQMSGADLPLMDFTTFVLSLSHSALMHLGKLRTPKPDGSRRVAACAPDD